MDDNESSVEPHITEDKGEDGEEGEEEEEGVIKDPATEILSPNYPLITVEWLHKYENYNVHCTCTCTYCIYMYMYMYMYNL